MTMQNPLHPNTTLFASFMKGLNNTFRAWIRSYHKQETVKCKHRTRESMTVSQKEMTRK